MLTSILIIMFTLGTIILAIGILLCIFALKILISKETKGDE